MVFESLVVDVLNRFLGDYVVNLDCSQLKLGIWGGKESQTCPSELNISAESLTLTDTLSLRQQHTAC